jgi:hypothetical protein
MLAEELEIVDGEADLWRVGVVCEVVESRGGMRGCRE